MKYKLIVSDMDGTLLGDNHKVTEENKIALNKASQNGVKVVPASGRMHDSAAIHFEFLDTNIPLISCNGAMIKETKTCKVIYKNPVSSEIAQKVIDIFEKNDLYYQIYSESTMMCRFVDEESAKYNKKRLEKFLNDKINLVFTADMKNEVLKHDVLKLIAIEENEPEKLVKAKEELSEVEGVEITSSWFNNIEVMNLGATKGTALKSLAEQLGIKREEIIAFGDNYNDLDMIEYAGMGVIMENADDKVKENADYITSRNSEDGVAEAIYKFLEF